MATIVVRRARDGPPLRALRIWADGRCLGRVRSGRSGVIQTPASARWLILSIGPWRFDPIPVWFEPDQRYELTCALNQPPLHPLHVHGVWMLLLWFAIEQAGRFVPAIRGWADRLFFEVMIGLVFGLMGMGIYFRRAYQAGAFRGTALQLEIRSEDGVSLLRARLNGRLDSRGRRCVARARPADVLGR